MILPEMMKRLGKTPDGYLRVKVGSKLRLVHNLVLEAFLCDRPHGMQACHNNGIPDDNRLENLRWDSPKNNVGDRKRHGTYQNGIKNPNAKYTDEQILAVYNSKLPFKERALKYGVSISTVYVMMSGHYPRLNNLLAQS